MAISYRSLRLFTLSVKVATSFTSAISTMVGRVEIPTLYPCTFASPAPINSQRGCLLQRGFHVDSFRLVPVVHTGVAKDELGGFAVREVHDSVYFALGDEEKITRPKIDLLPIVIRSNE